jgi:hypothetical protein
MGKGERVVYMVGRREERLYIRRVGKHGWREEWVDWMDWIHGTYTSPLDRGQYI